MQPKEPNSQPTPEVVTVPGRTYRRRNAYVVINVRPHNMRMPPRDEHGRFIGGRKADKPRTEPHTESLPAHAEHVQAVGTNPTVDLTPEQVEERTFEQIRYLISIGKTATQVAHQLNKPLDSVREEAEKMWDELSEDLITSPLHVKVQAIMRAMNIYSQSCEALNTGEIRTAEKIKYMGLALDSSKEIVKYQSEIATDESKDDREEYERPTRQQLDIAIDLLTQRINDLKKEAALELTKPANGDPPTSIPSESA